MTTLDSTDSSTSVTTSDVAEGPGWAPLGVLLCGTFLVVLDFFIVNVALPSVQRDLGASNTALEWLIAGYGLSFGGLLIAASRLGDRWGRRRMFTAGIALFVVTSAACGVAPGVGVLIAARVLQGVAAAMLTPMVLALVGDVYAGPGRVRAIAAYSTTMGVAAASGQLIGGALIHADLAGLGWRTIFLVNVPVGLGALALAPRLLPRSRAAAAVRLDPVELGLASACLTALMLPLLEGRSQGWPAWAWTCLAGAVVLGLLLVARGRGLRRRERSSLLDPEPFRAAGVRVGLLAQGLLFVGMAPYFLTLALFLQVGHGLGALESGLVFSICAVCYMLASRRAAALAARWGRWAVVGGAVAFTLGHLLELVAVVEIGSSGSVLWLAPGLAVSGLGMGVCLTALVGTVMGRVVPDHAAAVSGALSTVQQLANAVGVALVGLVYFGLADHGATVAFGWSVVCLIGTTLGLAGLAVRLPRPRPTGG